ncbi:DUF167 family protein [Nitratireductor sp. XY-223]|uniref:DUF167 family protein n=1 Tax=Nitratireductor sp. XY-223 TaxID=2561926 RepID=UPI001FEF056D|nr:DUF167 family protein [Nitratireductor sp. XY-223]
MEQHLPAAELIGWFRKVPDGLQLFVRLTPGAGRDCVEGTEQRADGRIYLKARVRAVPEKGGANRALIALVAKHFGVPKSTVSIAAGETARLKCLLIAGDPNELCRFTVSVLKQNIQ